MEVSKGEHTSSSAHLRGLHLQNYVFQNKNAPPGRKAAELRLERAFQAGLLRGVKGGEVAADGEADLDDSHRDIDDDDSFVERGEGGIGGRGRNEGGLKGKLAKMGGRWGASERKTAEGQGN